MPLPGVFSGLLWSAAGIASTALFHFLELIDHVQGRLSLLPAPSLLQTILALFGAFIMLLPRGLPYRWLGLFLVVPLFFPPAAGRGPGALEAEILDVGQGTAVIVSSGGQSMLYDSGPGDGGDHNLVNGVIAPALARLGPAAPHEVIISHGDLDHAGGLQSLLEQYPNARYRASVPDEAAPVDRCDSSMTWRRPGIEADSLHPSSALPYMGNDSSCVISIGTGNAMLLPGDISRVVEHRLLLDGLSPHRVLLVPHHGSATSSSAAFIERVDPEVAIATAGLGNRFNFPRPEIRGRYQDLGVTFWSTGECGAIRLWLHRDGGLDAISARRARNRIWRWPAGANCP
jgi:competence protein ComEC